MLGDFVGEPELREQRACGALGVRSRDPPHVERREHAVLENGQVREELEALEDEADVAAERRRRAPRSRDRMLADRDRPALHPVEPGKAA